MHGNGKMACMWPTLQFHPIRVLKGEWLGLLPQGESTEVLHKSEVHRIAEKQDAQLLHLWKVLLLLRVCRLHRIPHSLLFQSFS